MRLGLLLLLSSLMYGQVSNVVLYKVLASNVTATTTYGPITNAGQVGSYATLAVSSTTGHTCSSNSVNILILGNYDGGSIRNTLYTSGITTTGGAGTFVSAKGPPVPYPYIWVQIATFSDPTDCQYTLNYAGLIGGQSSTLSTGQSGTGLFFSRYTDSLGNSSSKPGGLLYLHSAIDFTTTALGSGPSVFSTLVVNKASTGGTCTLTDTTGPATAAVIDTTAKGTYTFNIVSATGFSLACTSSGAADVTATYFNYSEAYP